MKRIVLFLLTNLAILLVLSTTARLLGVDRYLTAQGLNVVNLLVFAALIGFGGAFISLFMSKTMAKWSTGAQIISQPSNATETWLLNTVHQLANKAGIAMPEVAIYSGEPNAFATGATRNNSLVAISTGLLQSMTPEEAEAVLAHEVAHIANGDMVTLTLIQGVVNTFVVFLSRIIAYAVDAFLRRNEQNASGPGMAYMLTTLACEIVFGVLASLVVMYFSRQREFRADRGAANLLGSNRAMIAALHRLGNLHSESTLPQNIASAGITGGKSWMALFASHPPLQERIAALQSHMT